jgi:small neutral amino acid transporter SnatA (MarC family)
MTFTGALAFFFALLNPFLLSLYLLDLIVRLDPAVLSSILRRGAFIAGLVFSLFAATGDRFFNQLLHVHFASFQIFGGIVFLLVGIRFFFQGVKALGTLSGEPEQLAGSIAMPFLIGPATVSAAVLMGSQLPLPEALCVVWLTMLLVVLGVMALKFVHDHVRHRNVRLVDRYVDITGRLSALLIGTFAIEMIAEGAMHWWQLR